MLGTLLVQLGLLYRPPAQTALDLQPLGLADLAIVLVASTAAFWAIEAEKLVSRLRTPSPTKHRERHPPIYQEPTMDTTSSNPIGATTRPPTSTADHRTLSGLV